MRTATLALAALVAALIPAPGADAPGSPNADPVKGPAVDTSFLRQYAATRGFMLGRPQKPKFTPDGRTVLFLRAEPTTPRMKLFEFEVATGQTRELLSPESLLRGAEEDLTPEERARRERQRVSVGGFADYALSPDGSRVLLKLSNRLYVLERATGKVVELKTGADGAIVDPKWSPDGKLVGYVRGYDVCAYDLAAGKEAAVTAGGTAVKTHGLAEFVAQEEMHRSSGFWWSPDSKSIAYEEADHTGVETWYVADPLKPEAKPQEQFYPRPGRKNVAVRLGVVPVTGGETVWAEWDRKEFEYLAAVRWDAVKADPRGRLTVQLQDRAQHRTQLALVDPTTGKTRTLRTDASDAFVNLFPGLPRWFDDGERFVWGRHVDADVWLDVFKDQGKFGAASEGYVREVRPAELLSFDPAGGPALIGGWAWTKDDDTTQTVVAKVEWPGERAPPPTIVSPKTPGLYSAVAVPNLSLTAMTGTTLGTMPRVSVHQSEGKPIGDLPSVATEPPFKPTVTIQKVGEYWTGVCRPRDFDPKKKYPVVVYTYGGPTSKVVTQEMQPWLLRQWLADQGFVVVAIDNRGTSGRGREWEKAVYQKFGTVPLEDQVKGLAALCEKFPELDRDRVGIVGGSFGGYMAANGVLRRPDVFRAAVAMAPVTDWEDYDTHYTERYMGLLPESKKAYEEASLLPLAKDLKRPLLLIHGTADDNVYLRHTLRLTDALVRAGRDFEVLPLPGVTHMISRDPVVEQVWAKTAAFFKHHLGEPR